MSSRLLNFSFTPASTSIATATVAGTLTTPQPVNTVPPFKEQVTVSDIYSTPPTGDGKPTRPSPDPPLPHAEGAGAKKIRGKMHHFGPWDDPDGALKTGLSRQVLAVRARTILCWTKPVLKSW